MKVTLETKRLVAAGIIDDATEQAIIDFAAKPEPARQGGMKKLSIMLAVLAALLTGTGAIMLLAHNWAAIPFTLRLIFSLVPLAAGLVLGGVTLFKAKGAAMRESSCVLIMTGIAAALALVSQLYHLNGELEDFLLAVLTLSVPFIYIFGSAAGIVAAAGMLWPLLDDSTDWSVAVFFIVLLPAVIYHLRKYPAAAGTGVWRLATVSMMFTIAVLASVRLNFPLSPAMLAGVFAAILAFGIAERRNSSVTFLRSPGLFFGFAALAIILGITSYPDAFRHSGINTENLLSSLNNTLWLPAVFWLYTLKNAWCDRKSATSWLLVAAFPGVLFVPGVYTGLLTAALMFDGMRRNHLLTINAGMILALLLTFDWFFSTGDTIVRGCFFIGAGIALAAVNLLMVKKLGGKENA